MAIQNQMSNPHAGVAGIYDPHGQGNYYPAGGVIGVGAQNIQPLSPPPKTYAMNPAPDVLMDAVKLAIRNAAAKLNEGDHSALPKVIELLDEQRSAFTQDQYTELFKCTQAVYDEINQGKAAEIFTKLNVGLEVKSFAERKREEMYKAMGQMTKASNANLKSQLQIQYEKAKYEEEMKLKQAADSQNGIKKWFNF